MESYIFSMLGWVISILAIVVWFKRRKRENIVYVVRGVWVLIMFTFFFSSLLFYFIKVGESVDNKFIAFIMLGTLGIVAWIHDVIEFDETGFYKYNFILQKKRYEYKDVKYIKRKKRVYTKPVSRTDNLAVIYFHRKRIILEREYANYFEFMEKMAKGYKKYHNTKIPRK